MNLLAYIDRKLNAITMYRLVMYGLTVLTAYGIFLGFKGIIPFGGMAYVYSITILVLVCWITNTALAALFRVPANVESWSITAFILFFLLLPVTGGLNAFTIMIAGFLAIASKFFLTINKRHLFNPVAISAFLIGLLTFLNNGIVLWWVATPWMFPLVLIIGLLVVRKIRKSAMLFAFVSGTLVVMLVYAFQEQTPLLEALRVHFLSYPVIFFGTIMLTEPFTMPPHRKVQAVFGFGVGVLFMLRYHFGFIHSTPELALLVGNLFAYAVSMKRRLMLTLREKHLVAKDTYEFSFAADAPFHFSAGQYLEWTMPVAQKVDLRGNRRYFTVASSPTESEVKLGVKFYTPSSAFKNELLNLKEGSMIAAGQCGGDFVLPKDAAKKLVFIAGGIGVTPFRSMIKYLSDRKEKRDITLIYSVKAEDEIAYKDIFEEAEKTIGLKVIYLVKDFLTEDFIKREVPSYADPACTFYLSGPNAMVENYKKLIRGMGVKKHNIMTDYFPGF